MSTETESYLAELEAVEAQAAALFEDAGPDGAGLDQRASAVIKQLRAAAKRHRREVDRIREEARTEARQELIRERQAESSYRRLNVPQSARALFADLDPTDFEAMAARAEELRQAGVSWAGQPEPAGPPPPDPMQVAVAQMQMAGAGGTSMDSAGDLKARMLDMERNPHKYTDEQMRATVQDFNRAVHAAERPGYGVNST